MFQKSKFMVFPFWIFLATQVTSTASVVVNITTTDDSDTPLPSDIRVTISTDINTTTVFNLRKVEHIDANVPVYSIDTSKDGDLAVTKETSSEIKEQTVAFYQDLKNGAVMQIAQQNYLNGGNKSFSIARGEYVKNNVRYAITPRRRNIRDVASQKNNQSDQSYEVVEIATPKFPDINSFPNFKVPTKKPSNESLTDNKRQKRQSKTTLYVDVTAFLDYSRYSIFLRDTYYSSATVLNNIQEYYAFIFSNIDLIYQNFNSDEYRLRVTLTKIVIFNSSTTFPLVYLPYSIYYYQYESRVDTLAVLDTFSNFLNSPAGRELAYPYDNAMLFIGSDLWLGTILSFYAVDLLGLASNLSTLCSENGTSSVAVEDVGDYSAALTGAHELGHILSARHDGDKNTCNFTDRYLMASSDSVVTNSTISHPWQFSSCTINYFVSFINSMLQTIRGQSCLANTLDIIGGFPDVSHRYLGQEIPPNKQCKLTFGYSSYQCSWQDNSSICYQLYCYAGYSCDTYFVPALAGTSCGCGKVCRQGECVFDLHSPDSSCDIWNNCTNVDCSVSYLYCKLTCKDCQNGQRCSYTGTTNGAGTIHSTPYHGIFFVLVMPYAITFLFLL